MSRIAFLGLGAMGRRMAVRLHGAGHDVVVYNRSGVPPGLASPLTAAASPAVAAAGAELVISMVSDDAASRAVWLGAEGAAGALRPGAVAIESSTLTPSWVTTLGMKIRETGAEFLDAPVLGSLPQAEAGALIYLIGGPAEVSERVRPVLSALGGTLHQLGETPAGATAKLLVNTLFATQVAVIGELLAVARRTGLAAHCLAEVLATLPVTSAAAKGAAAAMVSARFEPLFPIALVRKDLGYALAMATGAGASAPVTQCISDQFTNASKRGLDRENITAVCKLYT